MILLDFDRYPDQNEGDSHPLFTRLPWHYGNIIAEKRLNTTINSILYLGNKCASVVDRVYFERSEKGMEQEKILVVLPVREEHKERIKKAAPDAKVTYCLAADVTEAQIREANIIIGNVKPETLKDSENLRWIQLNNAGTEGFCDPGVLPKQAVLTNATGAYGMAISEHLIAMLFALQKRLDIYQDRQREHHWEKQTHMMVTEGSRVLVVGLGDIGSTFARKMKALGAHVTGIRKSQKPKPEYVDAQYTMEALPQLLPEADIVALSLPGYSDTRGVIGEAELNVMKKNAILLNVGRGTAIDSLALARALAERKIYGAGLDVTDPEPLPEDHPLWNAPHCIITPHVSGGYALPETLEKILDLSIKNLERYEKGEQLHNIIDFSTGYVKR